MRDRSAGAIEHEEAARAAWMRLLRDQARWKLVVEEIDAHASRVIWECDRECEVRSPKCEVGAFRATLSLGLRT